MSIRRIPRTPPRSPLPICARYSKAQSSLRDLPRRLQYNLPLNPYDRSAFWGGTERGYNDYPFYEGKGENCFAHELQI